MEKAPTPSAQVEAWIRGMLAQAGDADASRRARPFVVNLYRLASLFPEEYERSRDALIALLVAPVRSLRQNADDGWPDSVAVYQLVKAAQERHLVERTVPTAVEAAHLVTFVLAAVTRDTP
jgi:hypothetical protein